MPAKKKKVTQNNKKTYVAMVVDKSGSMNSLYNNALGAIKEQLDTHRKYGEQGGDTRVTLIQFDTDVKVYYDKVPSFAIDDFTAEDYRPAGGTAMFDAIGKAIEALTTGVKETDDTAYLVCVISDGEENSSHKWNSVTLQNRIKQLEATGRWTFVYMLSNVDIKEYANKLGISTNNVRGFTFTPDGFSNASLTLNESSNAYYANRSVGLRSTANFYTDTVTTTDDDESK